MKKNLVIVLIVIAIIIGCFYGIIYKCSHNENYLYYGNDDYRFAVIWVGSGRSQDLYCGVITVDDYNKWCNGEDGTVFVYSTKKEGCGNRIKIDAITSIENLGCEPDWLPMNFW